MRQLHYFFILALCLLMTGRVYPAPYEERTTLKTAQNDFDNLLVANQNMEITIKRLRGDYNEKINVIDELERKNRDYEREIQNCDNEKVILKDRIKDLEHQLRICKNSPRNCGPGNPPHRPPETRYQDIVEQIQRDIESNNWTGTTRKLQEVYGDTSEEYRFLQNLKHFQILPLEAAAEGYISIIKTLIINGLNVDSKLGTSGNTMLHEAAGREQNVVVRYLLLQGANVDVRGAHDMTAIHRAAYSDAVTTITILLENGANINDKNYDGNTPLHLAVGYGRLKTIKFLVDHKADKSIKNKANKTPLELALHLQRTEMVPFLN